MKYYLRINYITDLILEYAFLWEKAFIEPWLMCLIRLGNNDAPDSEVHVANMGPTWVLSAPDGPRVGPMNFVIRDYTLGRIGFIKDSHKCNSRIWNILYELYPWFRSRVRILGAKNFLNHDFWTRVHRFIYYRILRSRSGHIWKWISLKISYVLPT